MALYTKHTFLGQDHMDNLLRKLSEAAEVIVKDGIVTKVK